MALCHFSEDLNLHLYCAFWVITCGQMHRHGTRSASVQVSTVSTLKMFLIISVCIWFKLVTKQTQAWKCHVIHIYICYSMSFSTKAVAACLLTKIEPETRIDSYGFWHHEVCKLGAVFHRDLLPHLWDWSDCININLDAVT